MGRKRGNGGGRHWNATSTSGIPPRRRCSSIVSRPPLKACLAILFWGYVSLAVWEGEELHTLIWFGVSVMKIAELGDRC